MSRSEGIQKWGWLTGLRHLLAPHFQLSSPDPRRLVLWLPVALGSGSALYFSLIAEPGDHAIAAISVASFILLVLTVLFRAHVTILFCTLLLATTGSGFLLARHSTDTVQVTDWQPNDRAVEVTGWIESFERSGSRLRAIIRVQSLEGAEIPPRRIRIRLQRGGLHPGDAIRISAVLNTLPGPVMPGAYDPARAAFFDGIGLSGFAISEPQLIELSRDNLQRRLARLRGSIADSIRAQMPESEGGLAAALLTGDRSGVQAGDAEALRRSGLGHILAISGLHMALLAGSIYAVMRYLFAAWPSYSRGHDPRKPAAFLALLAALSYLILSGASVPTQRAFIMAAVVLVGVILDRKAFSFRSLALAAGIILIASPVSVIEPGFQMSFAAVAALIAVYEMLQAFKSPIPEQRSWFVSIKRGLAGLSITSLVAGSATAMFAGFHFQRMAALGFLANLAAMPVFSFWVMPAGIAALFFMPFGLEAPFLWMMGKGLGIVLWIAHAISSHELAIRNLAAPPGLVIALYSLGFVTMTVGKTILKPIGLSLSAIALIAWTFHTPPSGLITDGGVAVAHFEGEDEGLSASSYRRDRFDQSVFLQRIGLDGLTLGRAGLQCDSLGCTAQLKDGPLIAFTDNPESLNDDCLRAGLIIFDGRLSPSMRQQCGAPVLDNTDRDRLGGIVFWLEDGQIRTGRSAHRARRPWSYQP